MKCVCFFEAFLDLFVVWFQAVVSSDIHLLCHRAVPLWLRDVPLQDRHPHDGRGLAPHRVGGVGGTDGGGVLCAGHLRSK